jgi:hypothetical protein
VLAGPFGRSIAQASDADAARQSSFDGSLHEVGREKRQRKLGFCTIPSSVGGARIQSDDHHVQANLPAAKMTTHTMRNRNIETAKLACFLNSLRPSLTRVVRWKNTERTKRKIGIAAASKAMILKIIVHCVVATACWPNTGLT